MQENTIIRVSSETKKLLDEIKKTKGITIGFAVEKAVQEKYGKKNSK